MPPAPPVLPIPVPDTPLMEAFLAAELLAWLVYRKRHGKRFSAFKMAEEIVLRVDRPNIIGPDTIRRMLRFDVVQHPRPETLSAVAAYLVDQEWIREADLKDVANADFSHWAARHTAEMKVSNRDFAADVQGEYRTFRIAGRTVFETRLTLGLENPEKHANPRLFAAHRIIAHHIENPALLISQTAGFHRTHHDRIDDLLVQSRSERTEPTKIHYGSMFANHHIAFVTAMGWGRHASMVFAVQRVLFDQEIPGALIGQRTETWTPGYVADFPSMDALEKPKQPKPDDREPTLESVFHVSAETLVLIRRAALALTRPYGKGDKPSEQGEATDEDRPKALGFTALGTADEDRMLEIAEQNEQEVRAIEAYFASDDHTPTEKLRIAIDCFEQDEGVKAIEAGADVNARHPRTGEPLVFSAAAWTMETVLRAMLASRRLDLTVRDRNGALPSRRITDPDLFEVFVDAEFAQHEDKGLDPRSRVTQVT
ncbi:hypothetical protein SAMN05421720_12115 [Rhodospira trueperi]|uniref:Uncharacterized protein n=1 Tax=Rhodospira trueperi TaxID=69960 RepID=A0A1G7HHK6_9PROT|nr:hypothetical protein SAMN05421720_12115 [Rhodospira trueperi]